MRANIYKANREWSEARNRECAVHIKACDRERRIWESGGTRKRGVTHMAICSERASTWLSASSNCVIER